MHYPLTDSSEQEDDDEKEGIANGLHGSPAAVDSCKHHLEEGC
jgi:hypothetical protein